MAMKLAVPAKRTDEFGVNPFDIQMTEELRGRSRPPSEDDIIRLAESMLENSQLQPAQARRIDNTGKLSLTLGFTRCAAARLIRTGFVGTDGVHRQDPEFNLLVKIVDCNDQKAFERNIVENAHRNATSPIDDALNHQKLRDRYQYSDADIMRLYGERNTNRIAKLHKLLSLDQSIQDLIHEGKLAVDPAVALLDLPPDERAAAVAAAMNGDGGKVSGSAIKAQVRDHHLNDDNKPESETDTVTEDDGDRRAISRSMREVRKYFEAVVANEESRYFDAEIRFAKDTLKFLAGKSTIKAMDNALRRMFDS